MVSSKVTLLVLSQEQLEGVEAWVRRSTGFETISYLLEGGCSIAQEDLHGHMISGWGIVHEETPCSEEPVHDLQLWVNLRSSQKIVKPWYQELKNSEIPKPSKDIQDLHLHTTLHLDFKLDKGAKHSQPIPKGWTKPHHTAVLGEGDSVHVENKDPERSHSILILEEPLRELVVQHGKVYLPLENPKCSFLMNTSEEMSRAILDFRNMENDFERAKT
ncbi:hypothetical protein FD754_010511 [Muntiacus muntjak]|uniref:Pirin C-terminal domain-containing protein n=1 Tax=Muntiacus muntjak TaxID=9888 RepID=A0A5N3WZX1_MUNMU|nr:hypothetical protein FD754_010511 [Muntiacus muntjak]